MPCQVYHNAKNGNEISNSVTNFMKKFQIGQLLFKCNAGKAKGTPVIEVFRYLFCLMFSDQSIYMQRKTGVFDGAYCKTQFTVSSIISGLTGFVLQRCFPPRLSMPS